MYFFDNKQHHIPHIHAKFQSDEVVVSIPDCDILEGNFPNNKMKLLQAWVEIHKDELLADWQLASNGEQVFKNRRFKIELMNPRVKSVKPQNNYRLLLEFTNGEWRIFDVTPYLDKGIFKELKSAEMFLSVKIADGTVQWQNEADFCPDTLYIESKKIK